jgi:hypothetical protein
MKAPNPKPTKSSKKPPSSKKTSTEEEQSLRETKKSSQDKEDDWEGSSQDSVHSDAESEKARQKEAFESKMKEIDDTLALLLDKLNNINPREPEADKKQKTIHIWIEKLQKEKKALENEQQKKNSGNDFIKIFLILMLVFGLIFFSKMNEEFYANFSWSNSIDYYEVLGLSPDVPLADIKRRYRELATKLHPDKNPDCADCQQQFLQIQEAYEVLGNEEKRGAYDETNGVVNFIRSKTTELTTANFERLVEWSDDIWIIQVYENNSHSCERFSHFWEEAAKRFENRFLGNLRFGRVNYRSQKGLLKKLPFGINELPFVLAMGRSIESEFMVMKYHSNIETTLARFVSTVVGTHAIGVKAVAEINDQNRVLLKLKKDPRERVELNLFGRAFRKHFGTALYYLVDASISQDVVEVKHGGYSFESKLNIGQRETLRSIFELLLARSYPVPLSQESFMSFCVGDVKCAIYGPKTPQEFLSETKSLVESNVRGILNAEKPADVDSFVHLLYNDGAFNPKFQKALLAQGTSEVFIVNTQAQLVHYGYWMDLYSIEEIVHVPVDEYQRTDSVFGKKVAIEELLRPSDFGFVSYVFNTTLWSAISFGLVNIGVIVATVILRRKLRLNFVKTVALFLVIHLAMAIKQVQAM